MFKILVIHEAESKVILDAKAKSLLLSWKPDQEEGARSLSLNNCTIKETAETLTGAICAIRKTEKEHPLLPLLVRVTRETIVTETVEESHG